MQSTTMPADAAASVDPSPERVFVPVSRTRGATTLRMFVDPLGVRTGVAFSSPGLLRNVLGEDQAHVEMGVNALQALLHAAGTQALRIDPRLVAAPPSDHAPEAPLVTAHRAWLRAEGFAA